MLDLRLLAPDSSLTPSGPDERLSPDQNPYLIYLHSLARESQRTMRGVLRGIALRYASCQPERFPWWRLRYQHLMKIRADLAGERAPATVNKALNAIRRVLLECRRLKLLSPDDYATATDVPSVRGSRLPAGRALSLEEIRALLEKTETVPVLGTRNRALVLVLVGAGLRRTEVANLALVDYLPTDRSLMVRGKGNKDRKVPLHSVLIEAMERWIALRGPEAGPLFYRGEKGDLLKTGSPISARGVHSIVTRLARQAAVASLSPHDFRRTFITNVLEREHDLSVAASLAGHASTDTTRQYDRRGEKAMRSAVDALDLPKSRKK